MILPGEGPVQVYVNPGPELDCVASIETLPTAQVKNGGGAACTMGIFWSAVTVTDALAVQPFTVFVTTSM